MFSTTPEPPYIAVIFSSQTTDQDVDGYILTANRMIELAQQLPGFLGIESARNVEGFGLTVSYWKDLESVKAWKAVGEHQAAQAAGKSTWYKGYIVRISQVTRDYSHGDVS